MLTKKEMFSNRIISIILLAFVHGSTKQQRKSIGKIFDKHICANAVILRPLYRPIFLKN